MSKLVDNERDVCSENRVAIALPMASRSTCDITEAYDECNEPMQW